LARRHPPICDYEGSDYQDRFWESGEREYEDRVEAIALRRILPQQGERLLEVGAGAGRNTPRYAGFRQIVLLDYSRTQLAQAQKRLGRDGDYLYVAGDVYDLPFAQGVFDTATMIRTLHHMAEPEEALQRVGETLSPGGTFVLEYASKRHLKAILRWMFRRQSWSPFDMTQVEIAPLNFNFHPRAINLWLQRSGFEIMRQLTVSHFRLQILKRIVPMRLLVGLDSLLQWTGGIWQLTPSVFVKARAGGKANPISDHGIWRCSACGSLELDEVYAGLRCKACGRLWPKQDGIYDFRNSDASDETNKSRD
jgi:ubiquinone/menaquinone biosynthesis C-methylase UbiE